MANIIEIIIKASNQASGALDSALDKVSSIGSSMQSIGAKMAVATAPIALALGVAVTNAMAFDSSMTNVASVLGKSRTEMTTLNREVLKIGAASRAGPQAASEAFYDIAGGVQDAAAHMAILQAAIDTAEAGSAELGSTTNALISVMNSYGFAADDAAFASDVLTRTVGMGVGSMGDFAGALPKLTGLASSVGISFDQAAGSVAYMTTKGFSASESVTRLNAAINSILTPNKEMAEAMAKAGLESGSQALQMYGLAGTLGRVQNALGGSTDAMALAMGSSEAMAAANALNEASFESFIGTFEDGIAGATAAAQAIQLDSPAAQMDLLTSKVNALSIEVGQTLLPVLNDLMTNTIGPLITDIMAWAEANPEATKTLALLGMAAVVAGPVIGILGTVVTGLATAVGLVLSPAGLLIGLIAGLVFAADKLYPGGLSKLLLDASKSAEQLAIMGLAVLNKAAKSATDLVNGLVGALRDAAKAASDFINNTVGGIQAAVGQGQSAVATRTQVREGMSTGAISTDQVWDQAYKSVSSQFGGGLGGNIMASLFAPQFVHGAMNGQAGSVGNYNSNMTVTPIAGKKAGGGDVVGGATGRNYIVGEEGEEILHMRPGTSGSITPNDQLGGTSVSITGPFYFTARSKAEAQDHAEAFSVKLDQLIRARG